MSCYAYIAVAPDGAESRGTLNVPDQSEALRRIKEMGLFPTKLRAAADTSRKGSPRGISRRSRAAWLDLRIPGLGSGVSTSTLTVFTRQLATLSEAGMPLLRGLRTLQEQEANRILKGIIGEICESIENGSTLAESLAAHPKVFNRLYLNMVRAGEFSGALEDSLNRLADFMEKAQKIRGKVKAAMFYPCAVLIVAVAILGVMSVFVIPRFKEVFDGLMNGRPLPTFTLLVFHMSEAVKNHLVESGFLLASALATFCLALKTKWGRWSFDWLKLSAPILGPVFTKASLSRFARTLGTLCSSGVPILQSLLIVKETAGNELVGGLVQRIHDAVKEGEPISPTIKASRLFPAMVAGMVDVGEQTGALPEMLMKVADNCDEQVDNATSAMTSLLEPIMIVLLAGMVGSIVIAMFLPLIKMIELGIDTDHGAGALKKDE